MSIMPSSLLLSRAFALIIFFGLLQNTVVANEGKTGNAATSAASEKTSPRRNPYQYVGQSFADALNDRDVDAANALFDDAHFAHIVSNGVFDDAKNKMREGFERGVRKGFRDRTVQSWIQALEQSNGQVKYLRTIQINGKRRVLIRFDFGEAGINYIELLVDTRREKFFDLFTHTTGELLSDSMVALGALGLPDSANVVHRLLGIREPNNELARSFNEVGQFTKNGDFAGAYHTLLSLPTSLQKTRVITVLRLNLASRIGGEIYDTELEKLAADFGQEPELGFMLFDYYYGKKKYDAALAALAHLEKRIGEDSALLVLKSLILSERDHIDEAVATAYNALGLEPTRQANHWQLIAMLLRQGAFEKVAFELDNIAERFSLEFEPNELAKNELYVEFSHSKAFERWRKRWD